MTVGGVDDVQAADAVAEFVGEFALQPDGVETVGFDATDDNRNRAIAQCGIDTTVVAPDVVVIEDRRQHHVAARVEAGDQFVGLVLEVALDGVPATLEGLLGALRGVLGSEGVLVDR